MFNSKIDLFDQKWIDTIFEGRNTAYGAYDLRQRESRTMILALIMGAFIFSFLVSLPLILKSLERDKTAGLESIDEKVTLVTLPPPEKPIDPFIPPAPPVREMQTKQDVRKFTPPVVAPENEIVEEMISQDSLKKVVAGARNVDGSEEGEVVIDARAVDHAVDQQVTEYGDGPVDFRSVQVMPEYPGGIKKFIEYVAQQLAQVEVYETRPQLRMEFSFIIETDGSLTGIEVMNDGGNSFAAKKTVEILGKSKKWKPGINNGQAVRVKYTLPVVIRMQ